MIKTHSYKNREETLLNQNLNKTVDASIKHHRLDQNQSTYKYGNFSMPGVMPGSRFWNGHTLVQTTGGYPTRWVRGSSFIPAQIRMRQRQEDEEAMERIESSFSSVTRREEIALAYDFSNCVDVTWMAFSTTPFTRPKQLLIQKALLHTKPKAKSKHTLNWVQRNADRLGIFLTKVEIARLWSEWPYPSTRLNMLRRESLKEVSRMTQAATYVAMSTSKGTSSTKSKKVAEKLNASKEGRMILNTQKGIFVPQASDDWLLAGTRDALEIAWSTLLTNAFKAFGKTHTRGMSPVQDLLNFVALIVTKEPAVRGLMVGSLFMSTSWVYFTQGLVYRVKNQLEAMFLMVMNLFFSKGVGVDFSDDDDCALEMEETIEAKAIYDGIAKVLGTTRSISGFVQQSNYVDLAKRVRHSPIVVRTLIMLVKVFSFGIFGDDEVSGMFANQTAAKALQLFTKHGDEMLGITALLDYWRARVSRFIISHDPWDLFEEDEVVRAQRELDAKSNEIISLRTNNVKVRETLESGRALCARWSANDNRLVMSAVRNLSDQIISANRGLKVEREQPLGVFLYGPPGTAKSTFVTQLSYYYSRKLGYPKDVNITHYMSDTKHQMIPSIVRILATNDCFELKDEYSERPTLSLFQSLVDVAPLRLETASLADKEASLISPDVVIGTTNTLKFNCSTAAGSVSKLDRRYLVAHVDFTDNHKAIYPKNLWAEEAKNNNFDGCLVYRIGCMENNSGKELDLSIKYPPPGFIDVQVFNDPGSLILFLDAQLARLRGHKGATYFCSSCHLPAKPGTCPRCSGLVTNILEQGGVISVEHHVSPDLSLQIDEARDLAVGAVNKEIYRSARTFTSALISRLDFYAKGFLAMSMTGMGLAMLWSLLKPYFVSQGASVSKVDLPRADIAVQPIVSKNVPWLHSVANRTLVEVRRGTTWQHAVFLTNNLMVLNSHFFRGAQPGEEIIIVSAGTNYYSKFDENVQVAISGTDVSFYYVPHVKNIFSAFGNRLLDEPPPGVGGYNLSSYGIVDSRYDGVSFTYKQATKNGDCGLPLTNQEGYLLGIHRGMWAGQALGVADPVTRPMFKYAIELLGQRGYFVVNTPSILPPSVDTLIEQGKTGMHPNSDLARLEQFRNIRVTEAGLTPVAYSPVPEFGNMTTRKTLIHDYFSEGCPPMGPPCSGKAIFVDGDWASPSLYRVKGKLNKQPNFDNQLLRYSSNKYLECIPLSVVRYGPVDLYRAISGDPDNAFMNPRDNDKSVGYTLKRSAVTKKNAYTLEGDTWRVHPVLLKQIDLVMQDIECLHSPMDVCHATIKDEAYPVEKAAIGKGRFFYVGEHATNLVTRMYVLPIISYMADQPFVTGVNVAMNPASVQWKALHDHLVDFGEDKIFAADFKEYDLSHCVLVNEYIYIMWQVAIKIGYTHQEQQMLIAILKRHMTSILLMCGNYFVIFSEWLSGRPDTILGNCIMGKLILTYAYIKHQGGVLPNSLNSQLRSFHTGDDLLAVWVGDLNPSFVQATASELGYIMTAEDKSPTITLKNIKTVDYLKRGFRSAGDHVYAPLAIESILKSLCYVTGIRLNLEDARNRSACQSALRESFMHGIKLFTNMRLKMVAIYPDEEFPTYEELDWLYDKGLFAPWEGVSHKKLAGEPGHKLEQLKDLNTDLVRALGTEAIFIYQTGVISPSLHRWGGYDTSLSSICIANINPTTTEGNTFADTPVVSIGGTSAITKPSFARGFEDLYPPNKGVDMVEFLARPRLVGTWLSNSIAVDFDLFQLWKDLPAVNSFVKGWRYMTGEMHISVSFTGSATLMGMARFAFRPGDPGYIFNGPSEAYPGIATIYEVTQSSNLPHLDFDYSLVANQGIVLPFSSPYSYLATTGAGSPSWQMTAVPINAGVDVMGLTPEVCTFNIFVCFKNVKLDVIIEQSGELPKQSWSSYLAYAATVSSLLPFEFAAPLTMTLAAGSSVAKFFGWSRPLLAAQDVIVARHHSSLAYASGQPQLVQSIALDPSVVHNTEPGYFPMHAVGETTFMGIASRFSQVRKDWQPVVAVPCAPGRNTHNPFNPTSFSMTHLDFAASMFRYWSGTMDFCVQVIGSPLIRWRIGVVILPPGVLPPATFPVEGEYLTTIIEVAGSTCVEITVPWMHRAPMQEFEFSIETPFSYDTTIAYYSLTDPTGPAPTPVYPRVNLWVRAGKDFSSAVPSLDKVNSYFIEQSGELSLREPVYKGGSGVIGTALMGEVVEDLLMLTRRSCLVWNLSTTLTGYMAIPCDAIAPTPDLYTGITSLAAQWTFASYLASAYLGHSGGTVFTCTAPGAQDHSYEQGVEVPGHIRPPAIPLVISNWDSAGTVISEAATRITQVLIPDRTPLKFKVPAKTSGNTDQAKDCLIIRNRWGPTGAITCEAYQAGADDFVVGGYIAPPRLIYRS